MGREHQYGVAPPKEEMQIVGHSEFGTSFFSTEQLADSSQSKRKDPHRRLHHHSTSWRTESLICDLELISISLLNITTYLKIYNNCKPTSDFKYRIPQDDAFFHSLLDVPNWHH